MSSRFLFNNYVALCARDFFLNNRVFLVTRRKFDVLKTNIFLTRDALSVNMLILRTSNFQEAIIRGIVPRYKHSIVFIVHTKIYFAHQFKNNTELFSAVLNEPRESQM